MARSNVIPRRYLAATATLSGGYRDVIWRFNRWWIGSASGFNFLNSLITGSGASKKEMLDCGDKEK
jgi:hypothetical protein